VPSADAFNLPRMSLARRLLTLALIGLANLALLAMIAGLLAATWMPAYVHRHPEWKFGDSKMATD